MSRSTPWRAARTVSGALALALLALAPRAAQSADAPKWVVPAGERKVVLTETGEGGEKRFIVENGFLRAVINPSQGARIESLVYKRTNQEMTVPRTESCPGGLLSDQVWSQDYWHGDWNASAYDAVVLAQPPASAGKPDSDKVQIRFTGKGRLWAGITIQKTITISPDRSAIQVEYAMTSDKTVDKRVKPDFWFHNAVAGTGKAFLPSPSGVLTRPLATEVESWTYEPTRGWNAFITDQGAGLAATMEYRRLRALRSSFSPACPPNGRVNTVEWFWRNVLPEGMKIASPAQLGFFSGIKEVAGADDDAVAEMTVGAPEDGKAAVRVTLAALADLTGKLAIRVTRLPDGQAVDAPAGALPVNLKADSLGAFAFSVPIPGDGTFIIAGAFRREGKTLFTFEKELIVGLPSGVYAMTPESPREPERGRRMYVPLDYNFSKLGYETPHRAWAKPYAGGRPRVLAMVPARAEREVVELAQRFDMDLTCSLRAKGMRLDWLLGDCLPTNSDVKVDELDAHLEKLLTKDFDVIIVGESWAMIAPKAQEKILAMVEKGAGLLVVGAAPAELKDKLPLEGGEPRGSPMPLGAWAPAADLAITVTRALAFPALPPVSAVPCTLRKAPGDAPAKPVALLMAGKSVVAGEIKYGQGRIVQLSTSGPFALRGPRSFETHPFDYWEYQYALLGRLVYHAAGKESPVEIFAVDCAPEQVRITLRSRMDGLAKAHVRLRDRFGSILDERDVDIALKKDTMDPITLAPPAPAASACCLADVIVSDARGTLAWGAGEFPQGKVRIEKWQTDKAGYQPAEKVTLTATLKGPLPAGAKLRGEIWDGAGRKVAATEVPAAQETKLSLPVDRVLTPIFEARAILLSEAGVLDQAACDAWVKLPRRRDLLQTFFWGYPPNATTPLNMVCNYYALYRGIGMNADWGDTECERDGWALERLNMSFELPAGAMSWSGITKAAAAKDPGKAAPGTIGDPGIDEAQRKSGVKYATEWRHRNIFIYGCADENRAPPPDTCYCPICLAAFRKWLQETQYKTLDDLNQEWGTSFQAWDQVMPMTKEADPKTGAVDEITAHAEKTKSYAAWADMRQFNEWSYANHARSFVQGVLSVDPPALIGPSGTGEGTVYSASDWSQLGPAYTSLGAYSGTQTPEQDGMAPNLIRYTWSGYNKPNPRDKNMSWALLGGNNYGLGVFVGGTYVDPDWTLPTDGRDLQAALREMNRGAGQMMVNAQRAWDPVCVLASPASVHGAYALGQTALHKEAINNFMPFMGDLSTNYRAMSYAMVARGELQKSGARVLVLPHMVALSEAECRNIREWVEQGGMVIADLQPGIMDEHCRLLPKGQLDDLFGVDRSQAALKKQKELWKLRPSGAAASVQTEGWPCNLVETGVRATTAKPLWTAQVAGGESAPVVFYRQVGKGHAYYLACNFFGQYSAVHDGAARDSAQIPVLAGFQQAVAEMFAAAGVTPGSVTYLRDPATGKAGLRAPYVWAFSKDAGKNRLVMVMRDYAIALDKDSAAPDQPVRTVFDRKAYIYESLSGKYLGYGDSVDMTLTDYTLRIFALLPYRVDRMDLRAPGEATRGSDAVISATLATFPQGGAGSHWFRVDVTGPDGRANESYSGNVEAKGGRTEVRIPFALNDAAGAWKVRVQDVATGVAAETQIQAR